MKSVFRFLGMLVTPWYLRWLVQMPWWFFGLLTLFLGQISASLYQEYLQDRIAVIEALQTAPPPIQDIGALTAPGRLREVQLRGFLANEAKLYKIDTVGLDYMALPLSDRPGGAAVGALITPSRIKLTELLQRAMRTPEKPIVIGGQLSDNSARAKDLKRQLGWPQAGPETPLALIKPFFKGRRAGLENVTVGVFALSVPGLLTVVFGMYTVWRFCAWWRRRARRRHLDTAMVARSAKPGAKPKTDAPWTDTPWTVPPIQSKGDRPDPKPEQQEARESNRRLNPDFDPDEIIRRYFH